MAQGEVKLLDVVWLRKVLRNLDEEAAYIAQDLSGTRAAGRNPARLPYLAQASVAVVVTVVQIARGDVRRLLLRAWFGVASQYASHRLRPLGATPRLPDEPVKSSR